MCRVSSQGHDRSRHTLDGICLAASFVAVSVALDEVKRHRQLSRRASTRYTSVGGRIASASFGQESFSRTRRRSIDDIESWIYGSVRKNLVTHHDRLSTLRQLTTEAHSMRVAFADEQEHNFERFISIAQLYKPKLKGRIDWIKA